jgi:hypothetical protein
MPCNVRAKHLPYEDGHLGKVGADMDVAGAPTIRVVEFDGELYAVEGSHRLAQAHHRGETPKLVIEATDTDDDRDGYWRRVAATLPLYEFPHAFVLRLSDFGGA